MQSDAASDRLRQRVLTPEASLLAALRWRREDEAIAAEQAATWLCGAEAQSRRQPDDMDTEEAGSSQVEAMETPSGAISEDVHSHHLIRESFELSVSRIWHYLRTDRWQICVTSAHTPFLG